MVLRLLDDYILVSEKIHIFIINRYVYSTHNNHVKISKLTRYEAVHAQKVLTRKKKDKFFFTLGQNVNPRGEREGSAL